MFILNWFRRVQHLTADELAAYVDSALSAPERARVEAHLVACGGCRLELVEGRRAVASAPSRRVARSHWRAAAIVGMAAAASVLFGVWPRLNPNQMQEPVVRDASSSVATALPPIAIVSPPDGEPLNLQKPQLTWRRDGAGSAFRVTVTDESGQPLWSANAADTSITIPPAVRLQNGRKYFWYVDALRADGRSVSSGVRSFTAGK